MYRITTKRPYPLLLLVSTVLLLTVYKTHSPRSETNGDNSPAPDSKWEYRVIKEYIQNDRLEYDSNQHDMYEQDIGDRILPFNQNLNRMLQEDKMAAKQQKKVRKTEKVDSSDFHSLDSNFTYLVYSAHYDVSQSMIKLVGLGPMHDNHRHLNSLVCNVKDKFNATDISNLYIYYRISTFFPWKNQKYDSYLYACNTSLTVPNVVTISSSTAEIVPVTLAISSEKTTPKHKFAVCVEPMFNYYRKINSLKHFIAVNSMFGAEHFYFYVSSATSDVIKLLKSLPMVTVYPWHLGSLANKTHAQGQKASNAHCLYNHKQQAKYLVYIDIDEVLVPRTSGNWSTMIDEIFTDKQHQGAMVSQSKLFPSNAVSDLSSDDVRIKKKLWSITHTKSVGVFHLYQWSKVLVDTAKVDVVDVHNIRQMLPGYTVVNADPSRAVVHHYRYYEYKEESLEVDGRMNQFEQRLLDKYKELFPL